MAFGRDMPARKWLDARRARKSGGVAADGQEGREDPTGQELTRGETAAS
jgi:hypothetical protein